MPSLVTDWVKEHWLQLPLGDRETILRDTRELLASGRDLGDACDAATWKNFLTWIEERL